MMGISMDKIEAVFGVLVVVSIGGGQSGARMVKIQIQHYLRLPYSLMI